LSREEGDSSDYKKFFMITWKKNPIRHLTFFSTVFPLEQGSAEKESRKIYFFEKIHDFHGKPDFLNGTNKM
jgi:hypothetical protein